MKKILLAFAATAVLSACNLGSLNYSQSQGTYVLEELAGRMAYDGLSIPIQILNSIDWTETDIFDPSFEGTFTCRTQTLNVKRIPIEDGFWWYFSTVQSNDCINIECLYLRMLPDDGSGFNLWEAKGDIYYVEEGGSEYEAMLTFNAPVQYSWKEDVRTPGSRYEKYLVANGFADFATIRDKTGPPLDDGVFTLIDNEVTPLNGYRLEGKLDLK